MRKLSTSFVFSKLLGLATLGASIVVSSLASAAPTMEISRLPFNADDVKYLQEKLHYTQEQINDFALTIANLGVYDDHKNPKNLERRNDHRVAKKFYAAPFFQPSEERSVVGGEMYAEYALDVLAETDKLFRIFGLNLRSLEEVISLRDEKQAFLNKVIEKLASAKGLSDSQRTELTKAKDEFTAAVAKLNAQIEKLRLEGARGANEISLELRREVARDFGYQLARIGLTPTTQESADLASLDATRLVNAIWSLRARAANGQLAIRSLVVESGLNKKQREAFAVYRQMRPDVQVSSLNVQTVYARAATQTLLGVMNEPESKRSPMMIRSVNGHAYLGKCGATRSCNAVLEYTASGASRARYARVGAVLLPVTFEADVQGAIPDFKGKVVCDWKTGWQSKGRADVRDGAIIYDGDVTNKINVESIVEGEGCTFRIDEGDKDSAAYHALDAIVRQYRALRFERVQRAKEDKDAYAKHIQNELQRHANQSQSKHSGNWFGDVIGFVSLGSPFLALGTWVVGEARDFYWHTRNEDTSNVDSVHIEESFDLRNMTAIKRYSFDGFPVACWHKDTSASEVSTMRACPPAMAAEKDTEAAVGDRVCPEGTPSESCQKNVATMPTTEEGFVSDPF